MRGSVKELTSLVDVIAIDVISLKVAHAKIIGITWSSSWDSLRAWTNQAAASASELPLGICDGPLDAWEWVWVDFQASQSSFSIINFFLPNPGRFDQNLLQLVIFYLN